MDNPVITLELVRRKAEHHDGLLCDLQELSLHQLGIREIGPGLHTWCRLLRILYLQGNLISKVENLYKLKSLVYLNLMLNNIEKVEGLERCESLQKLDLTANFIGEHFAVSIEALTKNDQLRELYLIGNDCSEYFASYRSFIISRLPNLSSLDGSSIPRSERLRALGASPELSLPNEVQEYMEKKSKGELPTRSSPRARVESHEFIQEKRRGKQDSSGIFAKKKKRLFTDDGRPLNVNEGQWKYKLEDEKDILRLTIPLPKFLDVSLIDVDVQPRFVRVTVKNETLQLVFWCDEVQADSSTVQRVSTTGHLIVTMPKVVTEYGLATLSVQS